MPSESLLNSDTLGYWTYVFAQDRLAPVRSSAPVTLARENPVIGLEVGRAFSPLHPESPRESDGWGRAFAMIRSCTGLPLRYTMEHATPSCLGQVDVSPFQAEECQAIAQCLDFSGHHNGGRCVAFRALTNEMDWIAVKELISAGVIEENGRLLLLPFSLL